MGPGRGCGKSPRPGIVWSVEGNRSILYCKSPRGTSRLVFPSFLALNLF